MWRHAAVLGRYGDAAAYYSSPGGIWDMFWLAVVLLFARQALSKEYFRKYIVPADPKVWAWIHRKFHLPERGLVALYRGLLFYGGCRIFAWTLYARTQAKTPWDVSWGGPYYVDQIDLTPGTWWEQFTSVMIGAVLMTVFLIVCWKLFLKRLWDRGYDPPALTAAKADADAGIDPDA
jgi:hypothetical protein